MNFIYLDLDWFEPYEIEVCGENGIGVGVCSDPITVSTDEWSEFCFEILEYRVVSGPCFKKKVSRERLFERS